MFYVYQHRRLDTNAVFYVGKGKGYRATNKGGRTKHWLRIVEKHGYIAEKVVVDVDEELSFLVEIELIDKYKRLGYKLVNLSEGGTGSSGYKFTKEQVAKCRNAQIGKKHSDETRKKMSDAKLGKKPNNAGKVYSVKQPFTDEHRQKLSEAHTGKKMSAESSLKKSLATKGKPKSEETRAKMKAAQSDPERRKKLSDTMKRIRMERKLQETRSPAGSSRATT
jgi:hypothetical protein